MKHPLIYFFTAFLLTACSTEKPNPSNGFESLQENPLLSEVIADQMIDYVTAMQIRANELKSPIKDPAVLRAIDDAFIEARKLRDRAIAEQDEGKIGRFIPEQYEFAEGQAILYENSVYFGHMFRTDAAPGTHVFLSQHVSPHSTEELFSESVRDLGILKNIVGPQEYEVGNLTNEEWNAFRTVVLYSVPLKRVIALAQIRGFVRE